MSVRTVLIGGMLATFHLRFPRVTADEASSAGGEGAGAAAETTRPASGTES